MRTAAHPSDLEAALAKHVAPVPVRTQADELRHFAAVQRAEGMGYIHGIGHTRRWAAKVSKYNPGVGMFYGVGDEAYRARVAKYALSCRKRANAACAKARALEAAQVPLADGGVSYEFRKAAQAKRVAA